MIEYFWSFADGALVQATGPVTLGVGLPSASELNFKQSVVEHQWKVNEKAINLLNSAMTVLSKHAVVPEVRLSKVESLVRGALATIVDRQETLLIGNNLDWELVARMEKQAQLNGISPEKRKALAAAMKTVSVGQKKPTPAAAVARAQPRPGYPMTPRPSMGQGYPNGRGGLPT